MNNLLYYCKDYIMLKKHFHHVQCVIEKLVRNIPPKGDILAMKSTEKQTLSFQETA